MANFLKSLFVKGVEIDTASATTGKVLTYDGTKFAPATPGAGSLALDDLSDVVIASPEEFQGLSYNGTSWVNSHIPLISYVRNAESTTITTGTCVYLFGATGDHASVKRADNNSDTTSSKTIGVVGANITASSNGPIVTRGYVDGIDLSTGYTAGDVLWLGENGAFTTTKPTAPDHLVFIGVVVRATNNGIIYVATQNGYELDELYNVSLPSPQSGEFLKYNGSLWVADTIDLGTDTTGNYMSGISGTSPVSVTHTPAEGSSATVALASGYGDTQNPYASKTANYVLAAPNGSSGVPTFRAIVAADIPTLNQSTTGSAATWTTARTITLGGDLTGNVSIDGSANAILTATIAADSVALGTDTTGNYMSGVTAGTGISVTHTPAEGSSATIAVDATYNRLVPSGSIITWGGSSASPPSGYLTCDGTTVSRTTYAALYAVIGDRYGAGDGSTTFTLPNFASGLIPFSTTTLNASPGTGTRQTQTVNVGNTASSGHTHTLNNTQSSGHAHTFASTTSGNQSQDHSHGVSINTGNVSNDHTHSGNTGNISADHSHTYFKGNSGANANTAGVNSNHTHAFTTGGISANHYHLVSGNTAGMSVSHTHANTAAVNATTADTAHLHTIATTNSDTAHLHAMTGTYVVYLIKT